MLGTATRLVKTSLNNPRSERHAHDAPLGTPMSRDLCREDSFYCISSIVGRAWVSKGAATSTRTILAAESGPVREPQTVRTLKIHLPSSRGPRVNE